MRRALYIYTPPAAPEARHTYVIEMRETERIILAALLARAIISTSNPPSRPEKYVANDLREILGVSRL